MKKQDRKAIMLDTKFVKKLKHFSADLGVPMTKIVKQLLNESMGRYYKET